MSRVRHRDGTLGEARRPLLAAKVKRPSNVRSEATKRANWIVKRDARTAELVAHNWAAANVQVMF